MENDNQDNTSFDQRNKRFSSIESIEKSSEELTKNIDIEVIEKIPIEEQTKSMNIRGVESSVGELTQSIDTEAIEKIPIEEQTTRPYTHQEQIRDLIKLLNKKDNSVIELQQELFKCNQIIFDLENNQKKRLEDAIKENTKEIKGLKILITELENTIKRFQDITQPPPLTEEDMERYLSHFDSDEID